MPSIQIPNGLNLFYREHGSGPRTVLFLHGNTASSLWWERVLRRMPGDVRAVAPDLRGCGDSDKPKPAWTIDDLAEDIWQFMEAIGLSSATVVGHSLGGGVALQLTVSHPEKVERLMLVNPVPVNGLRTPAEQYVSLAVALRVPQLLRMALAATMPTAPMDRFYHRVLEESVAKSSSALIPNTRALDRMDLTQAVGRIQVPTLIVYGQQDVLVSLDAVERTRDLIPGAVLEVWDQVGHSPLVEVPERVVRRLREFLAV